ncbi:YqgE/AlgH family protein [Morganella psychrotolerans]|uniref:UPF0301 protein AYY17_06960 n=1 Tax=Morganella psychrotolerans TaxID=368603 RepID=A0A1B8HAH9_9GAMM|nr:YqgE/AlgH family protein [Morganella psychrotolerans]OBU06050.1 hypothetical protein AYY17_06960 [Morganella psychrotolerans]
MNLQHHLLIAMPSLDDPYFGRSVVYLCEHNENGAMGLVINKPIEQLSVGKILQKLKISPETRDDNQSLEKPVLIGGPVSEEHGFVLHSGDQEYAASTRLADDLFLTTSKDVLEALGTSRQPARYLMTLGYASWTAGQLEREIMENSWLVADATQNLIFRTPLPDRWRDAASAIGVNIYTIAPQAGHA